MTRSQTEPEFLVADSEKTSQEWDHLRITNQKSLVQVQASLRQLYAALNMQADISVRILGSLQELERSLEELR